MGMIACVGSKVSVGVLGTITGLLIFISSSVTNSRWQISPSAKAYTVMSSTNTEGVPLDLRMGAETTCEVSSDNRLRCWGRGIDGLLGGIIESSNAVTIAVPNQIQDPPQQVAVGTSHACVATELQVYCWGDNEFGQLGDGSYTDSLTPTQVTGLDGLIGVPRSVSVGKVHSCALGASGKVACWGSNLHLSLSTTAVASGSSPSPVLAEGTTSQESTAIVSTLTEVRQISLLDFGGCALVGSSGSILCWGRKVRQELGIKIETSGPLAGATSSVARPVSENPFSPSAPVLNSALAIASGARHSCAILSTGSVRCWGVSLNSEAGYFQTIVSPPHQIVGVSGAVSLALGRNHSCALRSDDRVQCWGGNFHGQLLGGVGDIEPLSPLFVVSSDGQPMGDVVKIAAGDYTTCVVRRSGDRSCGGQNNYGQLGQSAVNNVLPDVKSFDIGNYFGCAVTEANEVRCWGANNGSLQLGQHSRSRSYVDYVQTLPVKMVDGQTVENAEAVVAGGNFACARLVTKRVLCWGSNSLNQLGRGDSFPATGSSGADFVVGPSGVPIEGVVDIDLGTAHGCALNETGEVYCWGYNQFGQVGNPNSALLGSDQFVSIGLGYFHSCATTREGAAYCWGRGDGYQLGTGQRHGVFGQPGSTDPLRVAYNGFVSKIAGSEQGGCLIGDSGEIYCWGSNAHGQAGGDPNDGRFAVVAPRHVAGTSGAIDLALGDYHTCIIKSDKSTSCWGKGSHGQLGNGQPGLRAPNGARVPTLSSSAPQATAIRTGKDGTCVLSLESTISCWGVADRSIHEFGSGGSYDDWTPGSSPRHLLPTKVLRATKPDVTDVSAQWASDGTLNVATTVRGNLDASIVTVILRDDSNNTISSQSHPAVFRCSCSQRLSWSMNTIVNSAINVVIRVTNSVGETERVSPTVVRPLPSSTNSPEETPTVTPTPLAESTPNMTPTPIAESTPTLTPTPVAVAIAKTYAVKAGRSSSLASLAKTAQMAIPKGAKVSGTVSRASKTRCRAAGNKIVSVSPGKCTLTIKVIPKKGKATKKSMSINIVGSPRVKRGTSITLVNAAAAAGLTTGRGISVKATIGVSSSKLCRVSGSKIVAMKAGPCSGTITVIFGPDATSTTKALRIRIIN